jgi:hypothetical protein
VEVVRRTTHAHQQVCFGQVLSPSMNDVAHCWLARLVCALDRVVVSTDLLSKPGLHHHPGNSIYHLAASTGGVAAKQGDSGHSDGIGSPISGINDHGTLCGAWVDLLWFVQGTLLQAVSYGDLRGGRQA